MPTTVLMPALSPTMTEGNLIKWHKKEGDTITAGDLLAEIETDKATMEVEAVDEGILAKILITEGTENVRVNTPIAIIAEEGETIDLNQLTTPASAAPSPTAAVATEAGSPIATTPSSMAPKTSGQKAQEPNKRLFVTPLAKRMADLKGINLHTVKGSGPGGRIIKHDIEHYIPSAISTAAFSSLPGADFEDRPLSGMRKIIAKRLTESKQNIPHFYLSMDYEIDELLELRKKINHTAEYKVSVNDLMIKAVALALKKIPQANTAFIDGKIRYYPQADIAVAVAIEGGLVTPILRQAESKSLSLLSAEMKSLAERARSGKLLPEEYQGGSFSISNLGMFGVKNFQAIINPPQTCILAIGAGEQKPVIKNGVVVTGTVMNCTLSLDHRVIDGATGAEFLAYLKELIQNPLRLLL